MSDSIKHECGVALLRLRRPLDHFIRKYGTPFYGFEKMALLLEKQHNRGQDGAGLACLGLDPEPGRAPFTIEKSVRELPLADLLERITKLINAARPESGISGAEAKRRYPFAGELYLGHLRYGTFGGGGIGSCHPFVRNSTCLDRMLLMAGNFNFTNTEAIFRELLATGHHPVSRQDGVLVLDLIGHYLEQALNQGLKQCDLSGVLKRAASNLDGAFTLCGVSGAGEAFALRDPAGMRPGFFYFDDEIVAVASERPAIQTAFDRTSAEVMELPPGEAVIVGHDGEIRIEPCLERKPLKRCVFERIYFSRGNDAGIHHERKQLGRLLVPQVLEQAESDWENTFFSYIPNTAQICYHGMLERLWELSGGVPVRFGQIAVKDAKFRTFIADAAARKEFYMHIYDVTYGLIRPGSDTLVVIDDSIVRGNTMRNAILPILDRLGPKRIVISSSAPQVRYPDCYGIDMGSLKELVAFEAAAAILRRRGDGALLDEAYRLAGEDLRKSDREMINRVKMIYDAIATADLTREIGERLKPAGLKAELRIVFQSIEALREACPGYDGDWYFTGDYPTPGGVRVVNQALVNYMENIEGRAY